MTFAQAHMDAINEGIEKSIAIGEAKGVVKTIVEMVKEGFLPVREACKRVHLTEKEFHTNLS